MTTKLIRTSTYLNPEVKAEYEALCKERGLSVSACIKEYIYSVVKNSKNQ